MANSFEETAKRLELAEMELERFRDVALGVILAGSVAYSPNIAVTEKSDLDLMVVVETLKASLPIVVEDSGERNALKNRFFEGYCVNHVREGVPVSTHILSADAFDLISKCFVADIRVYRPECKDGVYNLKGFEGNFYSYYIKNIRLSDLKGVRTIVPISFINRDRFYLGIHRDKLLSSPKILYERGDFISKGMDKLWRVVVENLYDEANRLYGVLDLSRMSVLNALAKKDRMCAEATLSIEEKTKAYLQKLNQ